MTIHELTDTHILDAAEKSLGRRPDRIVDRMKGVVKFAWAPGGNLDPLNFSDWYHLIFDLNLSITR